MEEREEKSASGGGQVGSRRGAGAPDEVVELRDAVGLEGLEALVEHAPVDLALHLELLVVLQAVHLVDEHLEAQRAVHRPPELHHCRQLRQRLHLLLLRPREHIALGTNWTMLDNAKRTACDFSTSTTPASRSRR